MKKFILSFTAAVLISIIHLNAQEDLLNLLNPKQKTTEYTFATFKTTRIINAHSVEFPAPGVLLFMIQHRFGQLNSGAYNFFGLDQATLRLGFEYGITDRLEVGIGRSTMNKTFDVSASYKLLRQSSGARNMPVTLAYYVCTSMTSLTWADLGVEGRKNYFSSRFAYTQQLLLARKFSSSLSMQIIPTYIHKNLVQTTADHNDIFSMGIGGRFKLTKRMSINAEYFYTPTSQISYDFDQPISVGIDIETGGHVFQLHFSNAKAFYDDGYITNTKGKWNKGDIYFGFNISRVFTLKKPKEFQQ